MIHNIDSVPTEQYQIITKGKLLAAKRADFLAEIGVDAAHLYYTGVPVFTVDLGGCGEEIMSSIDESMRNSTSLSKVRRYLKKHAKCAGDT